MNEINKNNKQSSQSKNRNRNRNRAKWNKNSSKQGKPGNFIVKYQNILEQYWSVRKKYFELYFRADPKQKAKLEKNYHNELKKLNDFESRMTLAQKEELQLHVDGNNSDTIYSNNHEEKLVEYNTTIEENDISDPHYLESQKNSEWKEDQEESIGTLEDYQNYKADLA